MNGMTKEERQGLGALLDSAPQESVMERIPQFRQAEIHNLSPMPERIPGELGILVFNMERGVHLEEIKDFLRFSPDVSPFDVILANELDDGCARSGGRDAAREVAEAFGLNYVFGLEFIELANGEDPKGFHGNAVFSRWPIRRAEVLRLPEQYNWYFDRQRRIGGRCAVFAELEIGGRAVGAVSVHLENRTHGEGRQAQMSAVLREAERMFPGMPVFLGGDLNTNTFDGRDKEDIGIIASSPEARRRCLEDVFAYEPLLPEVLAAGYACVPEEPKLTRRKPLPGGDFLPLRLDWIMPRLARPVRSRMISTRAGDFAFAPPGSALASFTGPELSDHNAVWAACRLED